jgi:hypothetical protein
VIFLFFRGADKKPVRLKMEQGNPPLVKAKVLPGSKFPTQKGKPTMADADTSPGVHLDGSRSLNVLFNYNGHTWDAYEVLGCPAGGSLELAKKSFEEAKRNQSDPQSVEFLETALDAIRSAQAARK